MIVYLDTSVLLRWLLNHNNAYSDFFSWDRCYVSELLWIESNRTLNRLRLESRITDQDYSDLRLNLSEVYSTFQIIEIGDAVKKRAGEPFPTVIGTLDAIHLSSALLLSEELRDASLVILTHDAQLALAAVACGLSVAGMDKRA